MSSKCYKEEFKIEVVKQLPKGRQKEISALLMAVSWRKRSHKVRGLFASMSLRENCYDNAVAESFSQLLKREHSQTAVLLRSIVTAIGFRVLIADSLGAGA